MSENLDQVRAAFAESYDVLAEVGQGGMATVYRARDRKHSREVALKVLRPELAAGMGRDRFPREIAIVAQLSHPHILPLYDSGEIGGFLFYVMPFVTGESLRQRLAREGRLPVPDAVRILSEVADALSYAHAHGVIHRDIKPDNVMVSGRHALVTDFGVARAVTAAGGGKVTTSGVAIGTPAYMSPEQAVGGEEVDHRSDIYALGVLAYEMLAGVTPFDKRTPHAMLAAHVMEAPEDIATRRPHVPPALGQLVMKCLEKDKADRWQTVDSLVPLLDHAATPAGGTTPTDTRPIAAVVPKKRLARSVLAASAVAALVAVAVVATFASSGSAMPGPNRMAVMPLNDISGADGELVEVMHNQLVGALGEIEGVSVAPSSAMTIYRTQPKPAAEMAQELNVGAILEGNVFRAGERMRITLQLTNPRTIEQTWSATFDIDLSGDLFEAIDGVVQQIRDGVQQAVAAP